MKRLLIPFLVALGSVPIATALQAQLTLTEIFDSDRFDFARTSRVWSASGDHYFEINTRSSGITDLVQFDARTGDSEILIDGAQLVGDRITEPVEIDQFTFSVDRSKVLIRTGTARTWRRGGSGHFYVWDLDQEELFPVSTVPGRQMYAKFSPAGDRVAFVRENDLFVSDWRTGRETQLTFDGSETIINGTTGWVYEEELSLTDAFRFSPDGQRLAFWRIDQSAVRKFALVDQTSLYPTITELRYPKAGEENPTVRIGVVELESGETTWVDLGSDPDIYVAAMDFLPSATEVWLTRLNRFQNRLDLMIADARTGEARIVMTDRDNAWVEAGQPHWLDEGQRFLYLSERDGFSQIFLFAQDGELERKITPWDADITELHGVDEERGWVYFTGTLDGSVNRTVYRVGLDGGDPVRLSSSTGWHQARFNPTMTLYLDYHSRAGVPPVETLHSSDGTELRVLASNDDVSRFLAEVTVRPEFISVPVEDGIELNAYLIKPEDFDPQSRYPLLIYVYGGPGSQRVRNRWEGNRYLFHQYLVQEEGFLVARVDNRGTGGRGRAFKKLTYLKLGQHESQDQIRAARYLASLPYVDGSRIGIWGWSYGGYLASLSMFRGAGTYRSAIAVAPVTDWRLYDTIYTERYMRRPQDNPEGYQRGAPLNYADRLAGDFLLIHGSGDDNVHFQNSMLLIHRLEVANKQFDMRVYPNKDHGITDRGTPGQTQLNLFSYLTDWLENNLREARSGGDQLP